MSNLFAKNVKYLYTKFEIVKASVRGNMFGKISEKARRRAYLNALAEDKAKLKQQENNVASFVEQKPATQPKLENIIEPRQVLSGKEAIVLGNRELKVTTPYNKKAIINNHIADMKYYKDWRKRIGELELNNNELGSSNGNSFNSSPIKNEVDFSEIGRERGIDSDDTTLEKRGHVTSKQLLDNAMPTNTKEENDDDDFSFLDEFFGVKARKELEEETKKEKQSTQYAPARQSFVNRPSIMQSRQKNDTSILTKPVEKDYSHENFEESLSDNLNFDELADNATKINKSVDALVEKPKKASAPRKKKKKFDADIIGTSGFFTIR